MFHYNSLMEQGGLPHLFKKKKKQILTLHGLNISEHYAIDNPCYHQGYVIGIYFGIYKLNATCESSSNREYKNIQTQTCTLNQIHLYSEKAGKNN